MIDVENMISQKNHDSNNILLLDKIYKISVIAGVISMLALTFICFMVKHPDQKSLESQQVDETSLQNDSLVENDNLSEKIGEENENYTKNKTEISKAESVVESKQREDDEKKEIRKSEKEAYAAQLERDKNSYSSALEKLKRDFEYEKNILNAQMIKAGAYKIDHDCSDGSMDEQSCQIIQRKYSEYEVKLNYLEEVYKSNVKSIEGLKYW